MLPLDIERDYRAFRAQVMHDVTRIALPRMAASHLWRTDSEDDPQLLELAALLGISSASLIDERKLRAKLRRLASRLSVQKQAQLSALLGRWVNEPSNHLVDQWVEEQVAAVTTNVDHWLARAGVSLGALAITRNVIVAGLHHVITPEQAQAGVSVGCSIAASRARMGASAAVLDLNTQLLGSVAASQGVTSYRWVTEDDDVVRDNHAVLHYTPQRWSDPPMGGGTKEDEEGHPGSGFGCRCEAEPIAAPVLPG